MGTKISFGLCTYMKDESPWPYVVPIHRLRVGPGDSDEENSPVYEWVDNIVARQVPFNIQVKADWLTVLDNNTKVNSIATLDKIVCDYDPG